MIIIPRFEPGCRLFHELSPKMRQRLKDDSIKISDGELTHLLKPELSHPWLACFFVTNPSSVPQVIVFEPSGFRPDIGHFQEVLSFKELSPEWFWVRSWAAIQRGGRYWPSSPRY